MASLTIPMFLANFATPTQRHVEEPVRVGIIGVEGRGMEHLKTLLTIEGVEVPAVCDLNPAAAAKATVARAGRKEPDVYAQDAEDFQRLLERSDLDAVIIATPWECHAPMAVAAMKAGKYAASKCPVRSRSTNVGSW